MLKSKIDSVYERHSKGRICQGDILRDFVFRIDQPDQTLREIGFEYIVVLSQDCDLEHCLKTQQTDKDGVDVSLNNQFLPNILFLPAFNANSAQNGVHLKDVYGLQQDRHPSERWKIIKSNKNERFHFLPAEINYQVPDLFIDFKLYFTVGFEYFKNAYKTNYLVTVNELFRENLSQRFAHYLNRIGLPEISINNQSLRVP